MSGLTHVLVNLFTFQTIIAFFAGVGAHMTFTRIRDKRADVKDPRGAPHHTRYRKLWLYIAVAGALIVFIGVRTQITADRQESAQQETVDFAQQTQDCLNQLSTVLQARAQISQQNDDQSQTQRGELASWIKDLLQPPPDIAARRAKDPNDPVYIAWALDMTQRHYGVIADSQAEQDRLDTERAKHPIPNPNCGLDLPR